MRHKAPQQPEVPDTLIDALEAVLARLSAEERCDYLYDGGPTEPDRENHFFLKLEVIRQWLDYVEEDCGRGDGSRSESRREPHPLISLPDIHNSGRNPDGFRPSLPPPPDFLGATYQSSNRVTFSAHPPQAVSRRAPF